jgi:PAS domain S-box-containing protein
MNINPIPNNENERLNALYSYNILDSLGEDEFDRITYLSSVICGVPIALVSLIDKDRQWFKSKVGLDVNETARDISFCQHAIMDCEIFEIENALDDERFKENPLVQGFPNIRFYAGYPLQDPNGFNLGTLCVIDEKPHKLNESQRLALQTLGKEVVSQIVARQKAKDLEEYKRLFDLSIDMICVAGMDGFFKKVNRSFTNILGWSYEELTTQPFFALIHEEDQARTHLEITKLTQGYTTINFKNRFRKKDGSYVYLQWVANPEVETGNLFAIARDITIETEKQLKQEIQTARIKKQNEIISKISTFDLVEIQSLKDIYKRFLTCMLEGLTIERVGIWFFKDSFLECDGLLEVENKNELKSGIKLNTSDFPNYTKAISNGKPLVASDVYSHPDTIEFIDSYFKPLGIQSMLDMPIWLDGKLIGVICCESKQMREWSTTDISFAKTLSDAVVLKSIELDVRQKEREALVTSTRLTNLLANFQEAILVENENREIVVTNQAFCDFFSIPVSPDLLVGADCTQSAEQSKNLFSNPSLFVSRINEILAKRELVKDELIEMANGIILERDYVPIFINNQYNGHFWKYKDVTEKHKINRELESAKNELKATFDSLTEGVVVQIATGEIISCNPAACTILKLSEEQMMGKTSMDPDWNAIKEDGSPFPGEEHPAMVALATKKSIYNTIMGVRIKEDDPSWININVQLLPDHSGVVCTFSDITERKVMEENKLKLIALEASNKLAEEKIKARGEFLANMSHEIRTPMNAIIGLASLMDKAGSLNEKQRNYLDVIQLNSDNLLNIINDILDYSKLESGKFEMEYVDFNICNTVNNIVSSMQVLADKQNIKIYTNLDAKIQCLVKGDSLRYSQILTNLLSNAIKFCNRNDIHVELTSIEEKDSHIRFVTRVIDRGIGIPSNKINDILKPFTQETSSTTRKYGGTGLGLSIVSKLLEYIGSSLIIESELGHGSIFSFELNLAKGVEQIIAESDKIELNGQYNLLLVEDNQFNQLVAVDTLIDWNSNFNIEIANNGQEALDWMAKKSFDLVLMDIQMPIMDGYTATRIIRASSEEYSKTPIVAMTAHASSLEVEKCLSMGMNAYIPKPFNQKDLFDKIAKIVFDEEREKQVKNDANISEKEEQKIESSEFQIVNVNAILDFTKGKTDRIQKMIAMFLNDTPGELSRLQDLFESKDAPALRTLAHSFKPKYTYMGMPQLSNLAKSIEELAGNGILNNEVEDLISRIIEQTQLAYKELEIFNNSLV